MKQYETLRFLADGGGQQRKVHALSALARRGWRVAGETIEQGHMKGGEACCLATLCLPLGFAAGRTPNITVVTIERDVPDVPTVSDQPPGEPPPPHDHTWALMDDNRKFCVMCGAVDWYRVTDRLSM